MPAAAESHPFEQIGEVEIILRTAIPTAIRSATLPVTAVPFRRGPELFSRRVASQLVVGLPFLWIGEGLIGLIDLLEGFFGGGFLADIRVVLACQPEKGLLDFLSRRPGLQSEGFVVVLVFHRASWSQIELESTMGPRGACPVGSSSTLTLSLLA